MRDDSAYAAGRRALIVAAARNRLGDQWWHQGRLPGKIDCVGLLVYVGAVLGHHYDIAGYRRRTHGDALVDHLRTAGMREKPLTARKPGDVVTLRDGAHVSHVAILTERAGVESVIHASARHRKVVEEPLAPDWPRVVHCFAFPGVPD